jgi:hypothetical protein
VEKVELTQDHVQWRDLVPVMVNVGVLLATAASHAGMTASLDRAACIASMRSNAGSSTAEGRQLRFVITHL